MSRLNNTNRDINRAIFGALKESAAEEASMWESDNRTYKDRDEAEYYRNKELYANSNLARHREAMDKAAKACKKKGIKLDEDAPYKRYRVSFYVDTNEMNNMDIEEKLDELLKGSGLASTDETIDVELLDTYDESVRTAYDENEDNNEDYTVPSLIRHIDAMDKAAENFKTKGISLEEAESIEELHKGDTFINDAGVKLVIKDVDTEHLLDGEPQVTYYFTNYGVKSPEDYKCFKMSSVIDMINQTGYRKEN